MGPYKFSISIGDWSGDGHRYEAIYTFSSNKPVQEVREAFFLAQKIEPKLAPDKFCSKYCEHDITAADMKKIRKRFPALKEVPVDEYDGTYTVDPEFMVAFTVEYLKHGDPTLTLTRELEPERLQFYGKDEKGRHIDSIGYGLWE